MNGDRATPPCPRRFVSVDPARNRARFYTFSVQETLWGEPALVYTWGRIGGPGRSLARILKSREKAEHVLSKATARQMSRGYREAAAPSYSLR